MKPLHALLSVCLLAPAEAQEPTKPAEEVRTEVKQENGRTEVRVYQGETRKSMVIVPDEGRTRHRRRAAEDWDDWDWHPDFQGSVSVFSPMREFRERQDGRTGYGFGLQWGHLRHRYYSHRTRLEWNVFPEAAPQGSRGLKSHVDQYLFGFDHLFHLGEGRRAVYIVTGLGPTRWLVDEKGAEGARRFHTTKLYVCGGLGWDFHPNLGLEARYNISSLHKSMDMCSTSLSLNWRF